MNQCSHCTSAFGDVGWDTAVRHCRSRRLLGHETTRLATQAVGAGANGLSRRNRCVLQVGVNTVVRRAARADTRATDSRPTLLVHAYLFRVLNWIQASPLLPSRVRSPVLRSMGVKIARSSGVWPRCHFEGPCEIGTESFLNVDCHVDEGVRIGHGVRVGARTLILSGTHEIGPAHQRCASELVTRAASIEDGCWIGAGAVILPGVVVGAGCVVAAGSVVARSTEPNGVYAGVPARRRRDLTEAGASETAGARSQDSSASWRSDRIAEQRNGRLDNR